MPGESISCVGCHESASDVPPPKQTIASSLAPRELEPWYGPARGFDFEREVQPVLNKYCVSCHDGKKKGCPDLRSEKLVKALFNRPLFIIFVLLLVFVVNNVN